MQRSLARREGRPLPTPFDHEGPDGDQVRNAPRDLANGEPWQLSLGRSLARRRAAKLQFVPARTRAKRISLGALIAFAAAPAAWLGEAGGVAQASTGAPTGAVNTDRPQVASDPVKVLQAALRVGVDGVFGPQTLAAVKRFQAEHHLPVDGVVGSKMWEALGYEGMREVSEAPVWVGATARKPRLVVRRTTSTTSHASGVQRPVRLLQRLLHVAVDGEFGPETLAAVESFQRAHGLEPNGIVGPRMWAVLGYSGVREISPLPWARPSKASSASPHSSDGDAEASAGGSERPGATSSPLAPAARETDSAGGAAPAPAAGGSTFALCVANHEAGESGSTSPGTVNWTIKDSPYEGGFQWLNSTWIGQGGGRYAPRAVEATPAEQIAIFEAAVRTDPGAWPQSVPACGG